jgi:hypothetical protein
MSAGPHRFFRTLSARSKQRVYSPQRSPQSRASGVAWRYFRNVPVFMLISVPTTTHGKNSAIG